jgi:ABC-type siderophore export system fused ATPase/permease subunit
MPDPKNYAPPGKTYVRGYVRNNRRTREQIEMDEQWEYEQEAEQAEKRKWGKVIWWILLIVGVSFILVLDNTWVNNNVEIVIIIEILFIIIAAITVTVVKRNITKRYEEAYYDEEGNLHLGE